MGVSAARLVRRWIQGITGIVTIRFVAGIAIRITHRVGVGVHIRIHWDGLQRCRHHGAPVPQTAGRMRS
ncbi:hypothetical protein BH24ACT12_BH24ACT12_01110 [soil metagenome]